MGISQKNLVLIFRSIQPEVLFRSISKADSWMHTKAKLSSSYIDLDIFAAFANIYFPGYSFEELQNIHQLLIDDMSGSTGKSSVFYLLVKMGERVLRNTSNRLVCRFEQSLAWRNVYQDLGQDLFTTAFLAYDDMIKGLTGRSKFIWDAILPTDNKKLDQMLENGIAENHCHLFGTTQNFPITWACLMNYPQTIKEVEGQITQNLQMNYSRGQDNNVWSWSKRLWYAAYIRLILFEKLEKIAINDADQHFRFDQKFHAHSWIRQELAGLRFQYGEHVPVDSSSPFVLDYALRKKDCKDIELKESDYRLLSGERSFLYRCFKACFSDEFDQETQTWFYMYILLKENYRAEMIQVNNQAGFTNFRKYQDRKDIIYEKMTGYWAESIRLSVNANVKKNYIKSFEGRIAPNDSAVKMRSKYKKIDKIVEKECGQSDFSKFFYVYHFIKQPDNKNKYTFPRNYNLRANYQIQAKELVKMLYQYPASNDRIYGIDAANLEIGCRPETFATVFRYLRNIKPVVKKTGFSEILYSPGLRVTYHVGEDFLDIADGLRAIDEAIRFLCFDKNDRIGHALALGVDPEIHYQYKNQRIVLPKQDFLDNLVWLLYRSVELNVVIDPHYYNELKILAEQLMSEIYGESIRKSGGMMNLHDYYCSMQLRGALPDLYFTLPYRTSNVFWQAPILQYQETPGSDLSIYRKSVNIANMCQLYHFDLSVRKNGNQIYTWKVDESYIRLMRSMQNGMAELIRNKEIMIECNPTSNYLIGTFKRFDRHPVFRFNVTGLQRLDGQTLLGQQLNVSINTDDLGVFDTSLENEYVMMAICLEKLKESDGNAVYDKNSVYIYLDNLRKIGLQQSFK